MIELYEYHKIRTPLEEAFYKAGVKIPNSLAEMQAMTGCGYSTAGEYMERIREILKPHYENEHYGELLGFVLQTFTR